MSTSLSSPVQLQGPMRQPLCPPACPGLCVGTQGREGPGGAGFWGAVGQPSSSPHSPVLLAGSGTATLVLCSPSEPSPCRGSSHLSSLPGTSIGTARKILPPGDATTARMETAASYSHAPRGARGWLSDFPQGVYVPVCMCWHGGGALCPP